jgi:hypothetical protein
LFICITRSALRKQYSWKALVVAAGGVALSGFSSDVDRESQSPSSCTVNTEVVSWPSSGEILVRVICLSRGLHGLIDDDDDDIII